MHLLVPRQGSGSPFMGENGSRLCVMDVKLVLMKRPLHCESVWLCKHTHLHVFALFENSHACVYVRLACTYANVSVCVH